MKIFLIIFGLLGLWYIVCLRKNELWVFFVSQHFVLSQKGKSLRPVTTKTLMLTGEVFPVICNKLPTSLHELTEDAWYINHSWDCRLNSRLNNILINLLSKAKRWDTKQCTFIIRRRKLFRNYFQAIADGGNHLHLKKQRNKTVKWVGVFLWSNDYWGTVVIVTHTHTLSF